MMQQSNLDSRPLLDPNQTPEIKKSNRMHVTEVIQCTILGREDIPFFEPNISSVSEAEDIERYIKNSKTAGLTCLEKSIVGCCGLSIIGLCYAQKNTVCIHSDQYGFVINNGVVVFLKPGWHFIGYPLMSPLIRHDQCSDFIKVNNFQLIRIMQDEIGVGINNTQIEILLPGTHCRISPAYVFKGRYKLNRDIVEGPIKILSVKTGTVSICYMNGVATILGPGRYAVNSNSFIIGQTIDITQQNLKFTQHRVVLDGGINMLVEGLLTYQIVDVGRMIKSVDIRVLNKYLEDVVKADLTKIFSTIHLEQISSTTYSELKKDGEDDAVAETRLLIYESVMRMIKPQAEQWGVNVLNFQLESTQLADQRYSLDYESASLQIAKSKADLRAQEALNQIQKLKAETQSQVSQIQAETEKKVQLIKASAQAESTILEANAKATAIIKEGEAKAKAADLMKSNYGQELALLGGKIKIADGLKIHTLVMGDGTNNSTMNNVVPVLKL